MRGGRCRGTRPSVGSGFAPSILALLLAFACTPRDDAGARSSGAADASPAARIAAQLRLHGIPFPVAIAKPSFVLRDTNGQPFDFRAETDGALTLLFFGYTSCPDVCPVQLANLAAVFVREPDIRQRVKVVFVGVDAPRDTPDRVREWLDHFDRSFIGLTGTPEELERAQAAAGVPPAFVERRWEGGYAVSHAAWIVLYTPDNRGRLRYPFGIRQREWAHDLGVLTRRGWPEA